MECSRGRDRWLPRMECGLEAAVGADTDVTGSIASCTWPPESTAGEVAPAGLLMRKHFSRWALSMLEKRNLWPHTSQG